MKLEELEPERLDYIGVSFGATKELYKFWRRSDFIPVYLRQTAVSAFIVQCVDAASRRPHRTPYSTVRLHDHLLSFM